MSSTTEISTQIINWAIEHGPAILGIAIGAVVIGFILTKAAKQAIARSIKRSDQPAGPERRQRIDTLKRVVSGTVKLLVGLVALLLLVSEAGLEIGSLLATAGVAGVALGFGAQYLVADIITGFFVLVENQYSVGDVVCIAGTCGSVENITLRMTKLRDLDGTVHYVRNSEVKTAANLSQKFSRINLNVGVAYESDINEVIEVINRVGESMAEDEEWKSFIQEPPQFLRVDEFGDSAVYLKVLGEVAPAKQWSVAGELRKRLKQAFDDQQITIPYPQRTIHNPGKQSEDNQGAV